MDKDEFMFFLTGGVGLENKLANPDPSWLSDKSWDEICRMWDLKAFKEFRRSFVKAISEWKTWREEVRQFSAPWTGG
jgi:dynein heavy chain